MSEMVDNGHLNELRDVLFALDIPNEPQRSFIVLKRCKRLRSGSRNTNFKPLGFR
jgi:hypothetical protein